MEKVFKYEWIYPYLSALAGYTISFIMPVGHFMFITAVLVTCDLYTGTKAARVRGETINSKGLRRTVEKISLYFMAILLSEAMRVVFAGPLPLTYITAFAICIAEFQSNIENIETVTGVNLWRYLKDRLGMK